VPLISEAAYQNCERSIFSFGTHRHNVNTGEQLNQERRDRIGAKPFTAMPSAAGRPSNSFYKIVEKPADFYGFDQSTKIAAFNRTV